LAVPVVFAVLPGLGLARLAARGFGAGFGFGLPVGSAVSSAFGLAVGSVPVDGAAVIGVTGTDAVGVIGPGGAPATGSLWPGTTAGRLSLRRWGRLRGRPPRTPGGGSSLIAHIIAHWLNQGLKARLAGPITLNKERSGSERRGSIVRCLRKIDRNFET
jgi:hypothetical protein